MKVKYIVFILLALGLGALVYHRISQNKKSQGKETKLPVSKAIIVNGIVIVPRPFSDALAVSGSIEPNEQVQIRSQIAGVIRSISFEEGSLVKQGQELIRIDDTELQAQLSQALTRQHLAEENEKRAKQLLLKQGISQQEYEISYADMKSFEAQTTLIRAQLAKTVIKAPFGGTIGLRKASVGEYLTPDLIVANLVDLDPLKVTFSVPEKYGSTMKVGTELSFSIAGSVKKYRAKVYAIEQYRRGYSHSTITGQGRQLRWCHSAGFFCYCRVAFDYRERCHPCSDGSRSASTKRKKSIHRFGRKGQGSDGAGLFSHGKQTSDHFGIKKRRYCVDDRGHVFARRNSYCDTIILRFN